MTTEQMRMAVAGAYSGDSWKKKVSTMSDQQVVAIYFRFKNQNKL